MSTGPHAASTIAEKIDVGKYLLVIRRRKWWGVIPCISIALVFAVICFAVPSKYRSECVIRATKSGVAEIIGGGGQSRIRTSKAIVSEEMLRYEHVMRALADTEIMRQLERESEGNVALRGRLEEDLYRRVGKNTRIESMGDILIRVSYLGDTSNDAFTVLHRLVTNFVENALARERDDARRAREMASTEMTRAKTDLESLENRTVTFQEDHPGVAVAGEGAKREALQNVVLQLDSLDREIAGRRRELDRVIEQIEELPARIIDEVTTRENPEVKVYRTRLAELRTELGMRLKLFTPLHPDVKTLQQQIAATEEQLALAQQQAAEDDIKFKPNELRERRVEEKQTLEARLDYQMETRRNLQLRRTRLEEEVVAEPALRRELTRLSREKEAAVTRYNDALKNFKRIDQEFSIKMEGLVSFSIVAPARVPRAKDIRHIIKLAMMGAFVALAAGVGAIAGTEFLDQSFTDVESARDFLRLPSLGIIPFIQTSGDRRSRLIKYIAVGGGIIVVLAAIVLSVLYFDPVERVADTLWELIRKACKGLA